MINTRRGALDGLRALALIGVLVYHALPDALPGGFLGVEVFFVLSGFLLSSILLAEHERDGCVGWYRYAERRVRRLLPALLALLGALVVFVPLVAPDDAHRLAGDLYASLTGLTNWHLIQDGSSYFGGLGRPPFVRHLWSLSIEIQFYVLCPLIVSFLARRPRHLALRLLVVTIALSAMVMGLLFAPGDPSRAYYGTDTRISALLTGMLLAFVLQRARRPNPYASPLAIAGLLCVATMFIVSAEQSRLLYPLGFLGTQLATAAVIVGALQAGAVSRFLAWRPLRWLGVRSYGAYLWHWPLVALLRPGIDVAWSSTTAAIVTIAGAVALGHASYALIERPWLTPLPRRRSFALAQWSVAAVAVAGMAALVADLPKTDPIVSSLRAGQQVVSQQTDIPTTTVPPTTTTAAAGPVPAAPPVTVPPPPPPAPTLAAAAIGDSVMLGAAPQLQPRLGGGVIDAAVSRQFADGVAVAKRLRDAGQLAPVVVVHLGTNGPPRPSDVDALIAQLVGVQRVLLVTSRMPRNWEGATNDVLRAAPARHPAVVVVDWHAHSNGHPDWFMSDGIHLRPAGAQAFADLVAGALTPPPPPPPPPPADATVPAG